MVIVQLKDVKFYIWNKYFSVWLGQEGERQTVVTKLGNINILNMGGGGKFEIFN